MREEKFSRLTGRNVFAATAKPGGPRHVVYGSSMETSGRLRIVLNPVVIGLHRNSIDRGRRGSGGARLLWVTIRSVRGVHDLEMQQQWIPAPADRSREDDTAKMEQGNEPGKIKEG